MTDRHGKVQAPARVAVPIAVACFLVIVCGAAGDSKLARYEAEAQSVKAHIVTFDELDFDVFTHQKWDRLHEAGGVRGGLLPPSDGLGRAGDTHVMSAPENPERFTLPDPN